MSGEHEGTSEPDQDQRSYELKTLKAAYEDVCSERDRLRDARSAFSRQLGPLPVAAGISTGTIVVFARHGREVGFLWAALGLLIAIVVVSILYSSIPAYRQIRAAKDREASKRSDEGRWAGRPDPVQVAASARRASAEPRRDVLSEVEWYREMLALERAIYGEGSERSRLGLPTFKPTDLQDAFDRERTGLYTVQFLFVLLVIALALSELLR